MSQMSDGRHLEVLRTVENFEQHTEALFVRLGDLQSVFTALNLRSGFSFRYGIVRPFHLTRYPDLPYMREARALHRQTINLLLLLSDAEDLDAEHMTVVHLLESVNELVYHLRLLVRLGIFSAALLLLALRLAS